MPKARRAITTENGVYSELRLGTEFDLVPMPSDA